MQIYKDSGLRLLLAGALLLTFNPLSASAQTVKKHADGTVEVLDDAESAPAPAASSGSHGGSRKRGASTGIIPAYTKRMGGVSVHRNANGTVEVHDEEMTRTYNSPVSASKPHKTAVKRAASTMAKKKK